MPTFEEVMLATEYPLEDEVAPSSTSDNPTFEEVMGTAGVEPPPPDLGPPAWQSLISGLARMNAATLRIPEAATAVAYTPSNLVADLTGWNVGVDTRKLPFFQGLESVAKYYDRASEAYNYKGRTYAGEDLVSLIQAGRYAEAGDYLAQSVIENAPSAMTAIGASIAGSPLVGLTVLGSQAGAQAYADARDKNLSTLEGASFAVQQGGFEVIGESLGTFGLLKWGEELFRDVGQQAGKAILKKSLKLTLGATIGEGNEEFWTQLTQDLSAKFMGVEDVPNSQLISRAFEAGAVGAVSGATMTAPGAAMQGLRVDAASRDKLRAQAIIGQMKISAATTPGEVGKQVALQLEASGFDPDTAKTYATLYQSAFTALGQRAGVDPTELFKRYGVQIGRKEQATPGALQQAAPTFFSALERTLTEKMPPSATVEQVKGILKDTKQEERDWLGIDDFLKGKTKVSKAELIDFVRANNVQVQEVVKGGPPMLSVDLKSYLRGVEQPPSTPDEWVQLSNGLERAAQQMQKVDPVQSARFFSMSEEAMRRAEGLNPETGSTAGETKFAQYQLPGGTNYRELLLTIPSDLATKNAQQQRAGTLENIAPGSVRQDFISAHFPDVVNPLAHIRFNDREGAAIRKPGGPTRERILFIEEIQSDWHQRGRKLGYGPKEAVLQPGFRITTLRALGYDERDMEAIGGLTLEDQIIVDNAASEPVVDVTYPAEMSREELLEAFQQDAMDAGVPDPIAVEPGGVPDAPFKKTWHELALKRMIRYAAENGYDVLAWTTGTQQVERYPEELRKVVDRISWTPADDAGDKFVRAYKDGKEVFKGTVGPDGVFRDYKAAGKELAEVLGKSMGERIQAENGGEIEGKDFTIGGEGMKGFYDQMLPSAANKLAKRFGGRVGTMVIKGGERPSKKWEVFDARDGEVSVEVDTEEQAKQFISEQPEQVQRFLDYSKTTKSNTVHALPLTPDLKRAALEQGFPLFQQSATGPRGQIRFGQANIRIDLLPTADLSTFLHETGHFYLQVLGDLARQPNVQPDLVQDWQTIRAWVGATEDQPLTVAQHEQFARGFEAYLREGVAPSEGLQAAFERFKDWLTKIYQTLTQLDVQLTDEVRQVMDRLVAPQEAAQPGQEAIQPLLDALQGAFGTQEGAGLPDVQDPYARNRLVGQLRHPGLGESLRPVRDAFDKILGFSGSRLADINESLKHRMRRFDFEVGRTVNQHLKQLTPWLDKLNALTPDVQSDLDFALKNRDEAKVKELVEANDLTAEYATVRQFLDDIHRQAQEVGINLGWLATYYPRHISDVPRFLAYLRNTEHWSAIQEAIDLKETELGRPMDPEDRATFINALIRGYGDSQIRLQLPANVKNRLIDELTPELNAFYADSQQALVLYTTAMVNAIESRRLFGRSDKDINDSIGAWIDRLVRNGEIDAQDEQTVRNILKARFSQRGTHGFWNAYKNLSYIYTMGSPISAITQIGDLAFSLYRNGYFGTAEAVGKQPVASLQDLGLDLIAQEFQGNREATTKAVRQVFTAIGLKHMDAFGKGTLIQAGWERLQRQAKANPTKLAADIEPIFGADTDDVIADLNAGRVTDNVKYLLYSEVADFQPVSLSDMPEAYLTAGNARVFYMLKTYSLKLIDVYRNESVRKIANGQVKEGLGNLVRLTTALMLTGMASDAIKDFLLGRDKELPDYVFDNLLKLMGFSKWQIYKARQDGLLAAFMQSILPPVPFFDDVFRDVIGKRDAPDWRIWGRVPYIGKFYYWWLGGGREAQGP